MPKTLRELFEYPGVRVPVIHSLKYLGLTLDSGWKFTSHFLAIASKVETTANALARLMLNLSKGGVQVRLQWGQ